MSDFLTIFLFGTDVTVILIEKVFTKTSPLKMVWVDTYDICILSNVTVLVVNNVQVDYDDI
jgi:hypothetical protein